MYYTMPMANPAPSPPIPRAAKLLTIDLGADLKAAWSRWCKARGFTPSEVVRRLIETRLTDASEPPQAPRPSMRARVGTKPDSRPKIGHEVYFTPSEHHALLAAAAAQGLGLHEFVIAAVRAALANAPTYGQAELEALTLSNVGLVNVITAAAALRAQTPDETIANRLDIIENDLRQHIEHVSAAMAVGTRRWQLKT